MSPIKALKFTIALCIFVVASLSWISGYVYNGTKDMYKDALRTATRDATTVLRDVKREGGSNTSYDGSRKEVEDVKVDYKGSLDRFYRSLFFNLGISGENQIKRAFKENIPIKGVVGYKAVYICLYDDSWLPPVAYEYYDEDTKESYIFTLSPEVYYTDPAGNQIIIDIDDIPILNPHMTREQFKTYIIMSTINKALSQAASSQYNFHAYNMGQGKQFNLAVFDVIEDGGEKFYNYRSNIIDSPGFFAMLDGIQIGFSGKSLRLASFGGAKTEEKD